MKVGDLVKITDGSCAIRIDDFTQTNTIGLCNDNFKVCHFIYSNVEITSIPVHDVIIQNTVNKKIYLHSKAFIKVIKVIKEVTINEIEKLYGCKIKIINNIERKVNF